MGNYIEASRYHDISTGHKVTGHENKCSHLHGHNYRVHFFVQKVNQGTDAIGRVLDFSVIKEKLCMWLEEYWDHRFLVFFEDPLAKVLLEADPAGVVVCNFNPTAENMARYLVERVGPDELIGTGCRLVCVKIDETAKCSASYNLTSDSGNKLGWL